MPLCLCLEIDPTFHLVLYDIPDGDVAARLYERIRGCIEDDKLGLVGCQGARQEVDVLPMAEESM